MFYNDVGQSPEETEVGETVLFIRLCPVLPKFKFGFTFNRYQCSCKTGSTSGMRH